ncbi:MAG: tRNA (adenosine(37)-N6)-threonylcarbamoyltransferase complex dimerization subunit type 1 TsaB, partial [Chitinophagales bacterium]
ETSTRACSVAVGRESELLSQESVLNTQSHASVLHDLIAKALLTAGKTWKDLDAIAVSSGPGSYTGLRIGMAVAKGFCFALDLPLILMDSLECLAHRASILQQDKDAIYIACMDSRKGEIYYHVMNGSGQILEFSQALELEKHEFRQYLGKRTYFCGNTSNKIKNIIFELSAEQIEHEFLAENMLIKGFEAYNRKEFCDLAYSEPNYMKPFSY